MVAETLEEAANLSKKDIVVRLARECFAKECKNKLVRLGNIVENVC